MSKSVMEREKIRNSIIEQIGEKKLDVLSIAKEYNVSKQSIYKYIQKLVEDGIVAVEKNGRANTYKLTNTIQRFQVAIPFQDEAIIFEKNIKPLLDDVSDIVYDCLGYAVQGMLDNANEHSEGSRVDVSVMKSVYDVAITIADDGVGIFNKVSAALDLPDKKYAILELAKGRFTTEPESHTGEGIFFSSKVVDRFAIISGGLEFVVNQDDKSIIDEIDYDRIGTMVVLIIHKNHAEKPADVFEKYKSDPFCDNYGFDKTIVPVRLLEYGNDRPLVVSRSQARRLMARVDRFINIVLDFEGIDEIGQGFADEIFRVFVNSHPEVELHPINCSEGTKKMIQWVSGDRFIN